MKLSTTILEIEVLLNRIGQGRLDLQPDFQRANIWSNAKKQRLIDSVLRQWHVPPLHFVREESGNASVLDGQQRLSAIWEFYNGYFTVNGRIDPHDDFINGMHGKRFAQLQDVVQQQFLGFPIHVVNVTDYTAEEPFELFFRLNEPVSLTSAEKRNAFFGEARDQVRELVAEANSVGWDKSTIGFTNVRMAYDDIVARLCLVLERRSLREQLSGAAVTRKYRSGDGFSSDVVAAARRTIKTFSSLESVSEGRIRFNRATLFSWLVFLARFEIEMKIEGKLESLGEFVQWFEIYRENLRAERRGSAAELVLVEMDSSVGAALIGVYDDRASARVLDSYSVLARDAVICTMFASTAGLNDLPTNAVGISSLLNELKHARNAEGLLFEFIDRSGWGAW